MEHNKFNLFDYDKKLHFAVGAALVALCILVAYLFAAVDHTQVQAFNLALASGGLVGLCICVFAGWLKEEYDFRRPEKHTYAGWDAYSTALGGLAVYISGSAVAAWLS